jgi:hypothetical protein
VRVTLRRLMALVALAAVMMCFVKVRCVTRQGRRIRHASFKMPCGLFSCFAYDRLGGYPTDDSREIALVGPKGYGLHYCNRPQGTVIFYGFGTDPYGMVYGLWLRKNFR